MYLVIFTTHWDVPPKEDFLRLVLKLGPVYKKRIQIMKPEDYENFDFVCYIVFECGFSAIAAVENKYKLEVSVD